MCGMSGKGVTNYGATDEGSDAKLLVPKNEVDAQQRPSSPKSSSGVTIPTPLAVAMANLAGMLGIMQTGTNTALRREYFPNPAAACGVSFLVGLLTMIVIIFVDSARLPSLDKFRDCPWYCFIGGVLGGTYKTCAIVLAPRVGFATFHIAAVAGQLIAGIICDFIGFLHLRQSHPSPFKVLCTLVVLAGTVLSTETDPEIHADSSNAALFYVTIACLAGAVLPIQALINFQLGDHIGTTFHAVTVNFFVGSVAMWSVVGLEVNLINGNERIFLIQNGDYREEWWVWTGGSMGAILIVCVTLSLPSLGAATFSLIFISTQLLSALVADTIGAFGFERVPLDSSSFLRVLGVVIATLAAAICNVKLPAWLGVLNKWPSNCDSTRINRSASLLSPVISRARRMRNRLSSCSEDQNM